MSINPAYYQTQPSAHSLFRLLTESPEYYIKTLKVATKWAKESFELTDEQSSLIESMRAGIKDTAFFLKILKIEKLVQDQRKHLAAMKHEIPAWMEKFSTVESTKAHLYEGYSKIFVKHIATFLYNTSDFFDCSISALNITPIKWLIPYFSNFSDLIYIPIGIQTLSQSSKFLRESTESTNYIALKERELHQLKCAKSFLGLNVGAVTILSLTMRFTPYTPVMLVVSTASLVLKIWIHRTELVIEEASTVGSRRYIKISAETFVHDNFLKAR